MIPKGLKDVIFTRARRRAELKKQGDEAWKGLLPYDFELRNEDGTTMVVSSPGSKFSWKRLGIRVAFAALTALITRGVNKAIDPE